MKRIALIPFLMLYLLTTFSMSANIHFCGGKLEAFEVNSAQQNDCCCETEEEQSDCCTDKHITIQPVDQHQIEAPQPLSTLLPTVHYAFIEHSTSDVLSMIHFENLFSYSHAPPPLARHTSLFISNCSLLI